MEICVGEYVRIDKDHRIIALGIAKVVKTINETIYVKNNFELPITIDKNSISKHSKNIIDLIEVGDYVNGIRILDITGDYVLTAEYNCCKQRLNNKIKTILTKEQMEANQYVVK